MITADLILTDLWQKNRKHPSGAP